jgi:hypothetical protein
MTTPGQPGTSRPREGGPTFASRPHLETLRQATMSHVGTWPGRCLDATACKLSRLSLHLHSALRSWQFTTLQFRFEGRAVIMTRLQCIAASHLIQGTSERQLHPSEMFQRCHEWRHAPSQTTADRETCVYAPNAMWHLYQAVSIPDCFFSVKCREASSASQFPLRAEAETTFSLLAAEQADVLLRRRDFQSPRLGYWA